MWHDQPNLPGNRPTRLRTAPSRTPLVLSWDTASSNGFQVHPPDDRAT